MQIAIFGTDVYRRTWKLIEPLLPRHKRRGHPRTPLRPVVNALLYLANSGCAWRLLPKSFPPWKTIYHYFRTWSRDHTGSAINDRLRALVRARHSKQCRPAAAVLDSQTVRSNPHGDMVGYDAAKKTKGRKRFLL